MHDEKREFAKRLNEALDDAGIPAKFYGRQQAVVALVKPYFKISQKGARKWLEGEAMPVTSRIPILAGILGVRSEWLLSGDGPKRDGDAQEPSPWEMLVNTEELPRESRETMERWARALRSGQITPEQFDSLAAAVLGDRSK